MKHTLVLACALAALVSNVAAAACPDTMAHLASKLPRYNRADLDQVRDTILNTRIQDGISAAAAQGYSAKQAAALTLQQAQANEQQRPAATECIRKTAVDPDGVIAQLENGTYSFSDNPGIMESCAAAYVLYFYGAVANKEAAVAMACWANSEP